LGAPTAFGLIGFAIDRNHCGNDDWFCGLGGLAIGMITGYVVAVTVDAAVFAYDEAPDDRESASRRRPRAPTLQLAPMIAPLHGGATAGVTGSF
jgi:hypothetical protein